MDKSALRILIVEDEPLTRAGLREGIDWMRAGCEICGEAADGQEALHYLLQRSPLPDVVLTDVEMPRMDGLELLREIRERGFPVITVVLSGYDQFRYAQNALRYGAVEYLLKPLRENEVLDVFSRLREQVGRTRREIEMRRNVNSIIPIDSDQVLELALSFCLTDQKQDVAAFGSLLRHHGYPGGDEVSLALFECAGKQKTGEMEQLVRVWMRRLLPLRCVCANLYDGVVALMLCPADEAMAVLNEAFRSSRDQVTALSLRAVLFPQVISLSSALTLPQLRRYKSESFYFSFGGVHRYAEAGAGEPPPCGPDTLDRCMERYIREGRPQTLRGALREHMNALTASRPSRDLCVIKLTEAYTQAAERLRSAEPRLTAQSFEELYLSLTRCASKDELAERFAAAANELYMEYQRLIRGETDVIEQVRRYIDEHYAEPLTLTSLAERFFLSPSYLSMQFGKKAGETLSVYIRNVRLRHAKYALVSTRLSIYEVSILVGYGDYHYFCNIFKKECGVSPLHYRRKNSAAGAVERPGDGMRL